MSRRAWGLVTLLLLAAACGGGGDDDGGSTDRDYLETTHNEFLAECRRDAGDGDASCAEQLECIEQELTHEEYVQMDLDEAGGFPREELTEAREKCASP